MNTTEHLLYQRIMTNIDALPEMLSVFERILEERGNVAIPKRISPLPKDFGLSLATFSKEERRASLVISTFFKNFPPAMVSEYINLGCKEKIARLILRYLNEESKNVEKIRDLLTSFSRIPAGKIHLPTTMTLDIRVNLISQFISTHLPYISIAKNYINMRDISQILDHSVSSSVATGMVGGKAAGMILANRIVRPSLEERDEVLDPLIEEVDSYYIKSSIISEFTTRNHLEECHSIKYFEGEEFERERERLFKRFMDGTFSDQSIEQFKAILKKTKGSPLILRSSSYLEDGVGYSFTGKYDSFFISNLGTQDERLEELLMAIKKVYFSLYSESAIQYRKDRELLDFNEKMSVLVQKVVGKAYGKYYLPAAGIVGFSRNMYCWNKRIKPEDGMLRMVMGLGTRAVDRVGDDYPRMVSLSAPALRPEITKEEKIKYSQRYLDVLNLDTKQVETIHFVDFVNTVWEQGEKFNVQDLISIDQDGELRRPMLMPDKLEYNRCAITFDGLLANRKFVELMKTIFRKIEHAYNMPVDMEFAYHEGKLYILQCRTLSERKIKNNVKLPVVDDDDVLFTVDKGFTGAEIRNIDYIVYIDRDGYENLRTSEEKYEVARIVGRINKELADSRYILMGPGRWGTCSVDLGIGVVYGDINHTQMLIEMGWKRGGVTPELSYGTHFFQDLVEADIVPLPIYPDNEKVVFNESFFTKARNEYASYEKLPRAFEPIIKIIDVKKEKNGKTFNVYLDGESMKGIGCFE